MQETTKRHSSSYRDPSGFLFYHNNNLYRQVNRSFQTDYDLFISSGLYNKLTEQKLLIAHKESIDNLTGSDDWYKTLEPETIPFISYPYEWCFDMLRDAALVTIQLAMEAMQYGMMLKDASAYNLQYYQGRMIFIDSLSFEKYDDQKPWIAYRQFCEHFLAPLAISHYLKEPLQKLLITYPDGIPLGLAKKLLPFRSKFTLNTYLHLHLHGSISEKPKKENQTTQSFSRQKMKNLLQSLKDSVQSFSLNKTSGVWSGYYDEANQRADYVEQKKKIISDWCNRIPFKTAIDLGANEGEFSKIAAEKAEWMVSTDLDHYSVNQLYQQCKEKNPNILPLVIDLSSPTPGLGVNNEERFSLFQRTKFDLVMALALIHHLAIGKNIPMDKIARMMRNAGDHLIIEFVPKQDDKIRFMLSQKKDIYDWYTQENFLTIFSSYYRIIESKEISDSKRVLYLMQAI